MFQINNLAVGWCWMVATPKDCLKLFFQQAGAPRAKGSTTRCNEPKAHAVPAFGAVRTGGRGQLSDHQQQRCLLFADRSVSSLIAMKFRRDPL